MNKRQVVRLVYEGKKPPYVPWSFGFTYEAMEKLKAHYGASVDMEEVLANHFLGLGNGIGFFNDIGNNRMRDVFGVVWDRTVDKDIGIVEGCILPEPTLRGYQFPDPLDQRFFCDIPQRIRKYGDRFRVFAIGFSLYERAWTLRGMENLMVDFYENPDFVDELLNAIGDYNIAQVREAVKAGFQPREPCPMARSRMCDGNPSTCWNWAAKAATSFPRPTRWKAMCRWKICWSSSAAHKHK